MPVTERVISLDSHIETNNSHELQYKEGTFGILSFEGLPKGCSPAQVVHCIKLLEHAVTCNSTPGQCLESGGCGRTRQVLIHHSSCRKMRRQGEECNICHQLLALCRNHSDRCQATSNCAVPYCKNNEVKVVPDPNQIHYNPPTVKGNRKEFQYVFGKLSETMALPTKQQKIRGIARLLETNQRATMQIFRYILKKQQSLPVSLRHQMKNLVISKGIKPSMDQCPRRVLNTTYTEVLPCMLKLVVVVRAPVG